MKSREELLKSSEYWKVEIQIQLFNLFDNYLIKNNMSRTDFSQKNNISKKLISDILGGDFNGSLSKFVELCLIVGKVPTIKFVNIETILEEDKLL